MANRRKPRRLRKMSYSASVQTGIVEDFIELCNLKGEYHSEVVEKLMADYIKKSER